MLIPDIGIDPGENRKMAAIGCRDVHSRLRHGCQQAHRLERDGLTSGVWSRHQENGVLAPHIDVDGHHGLSWQQGMARTNQVERVLGGQQFCAVRSDRPAIRAEFRRDASQLKAVARLGQGQVQLGEQLHIMDEGLGLARHQTGQLGQDALDLALLLQLQLMPLVV